MLRVALVADASSLLIDVALMVAIRHLAIGEYVLGCYIVPAHTYAWILSCVYRIRQPQLISVLAVSDLSSFRRAALVSPMAIDNLRK